MNAFENRHDPMLGTSDANIDNNDSQQDHNNSKDFHLNTALPAKARIISKTIPKIQNPPAMKKPILTCWAAWLGI
jgi:hypothetical protein